MILNFLLIMVVSAILFSLLIPPIKVEDAKSQDFNDGGLPRATENAPIAYLVGKDRLNSPNTLYVGRFEAKAHKKKVKTGLFRSKKVISRYTYKLTIDLGFCTGGDDPVTLHEVFIDDVSVWQGSLSTEADFSINQPRLFGGESNGGGFITSHCRWFPGTFDQNKSAQVDLELGPGNLLPNYKGIAHLVIRAEIGESPQLRKIGIVASRFTNNLGLADGKHIIGGTTSNPAEVLYTVMVDSWTGMGVDPALIDFDQFTDEAERYYTENNGCAGSLYTAKDGKAFAQDIISQVDAIVGVNPSTNQLTLRSLRFDYDPDTLPVYDEDDIISVDSFSQTLWSDLVSQVKVTFKNEANLYAEATAMDQDLAIAGITGKLKTAMISMPMVKKTALATELAGRELNQLSKPATSAVLIFNRRGYSLKPGDVFRWSWTDYGISGMVMRVKKVQAGADDDGTIRVEVTKDPYGEIYTTFGVPVVTPPEPLVPEPEEVSLMVAWDAHRMIIDNFTDITASASTDSSYLMIMPANPTPSLDGSVTALVKDDDTYAYEDLAFPTQLVLLADIDIMDGFDDGIIPSIDVEVIGDIPDDWTTGGDENTVRYGGNLILVHDEVMGFENYTDNLDGTVTLLSVHRGLLNTKQWTHTVANTAIFPMNDFSYISESDVFLPDSPVNIKFLPSVGIYSFGVDEVSPFAVDVYGAYHRPDPPDYITINSLRASDDEFSSGETITVDWKPRNRLENTIRLIGDTEDTVPGGMTWDLYVVDPEDDVEYYSDTGLTSPTHTFDVPTDTDLYGKVVEIRIYTQMAGLTSVTYDFYRFKVSGPALLLSGDGEPGRLLLSGDGEPGGLSI